MLVLGILKYMYNNNKQKEQTLQSDCFLKHLTVLLQPISISFELFELY